MSVEGIDWDSDDSLGIIESSAWAERGFCSKCGSSLFYRVTAPGKYQGMTSLALGSLDDQSGLTMTREWFIDKKPDVYAFEGDRRKVTEAEVAAMFGG